MKSVNYYVGDLLRRMGYKVLPRYRMPESTLNLLAFGLSHLRHQPGALVVVQVGAFDGELSDPLKNSINANGDTVLLVEPQPIACNRLRERYKNHGNVIVENSAVSGKDGEIKMFLPKDEEISQKATISETQLGKFGLGKSGVREITVNSLSVSSLLKKHGLEQIDVLQIDTEGHDFKILMQFLGLGIEPRVINLETQHLPREELVLLRQKLTELDYGFSEYGVDIFAIKRSEIQ